MASGELLIQTVSTEEMLKILECPVCLELPFPPIYQCINGHIICKNCQPKLTICAVCMQRLSDVRNLTAEQIVTASQFICKYEGNGCPAVLNGSAMEVHLKTCQFRNIRHGQQRRTQMRSPNQVLKELTSFADELKPGLNEVESSFKKIIQKLFFELQSNCKALQQSRVDEEIDDEEFKRQKYSLDRFKIVGSVGKNTNIRTFSEFDCVIFINNRDKPGGGFKEVLDDFELTMRIMGTTLTPQGQFFIHQVDRMERSIYVGVHAWDTQEEENQDVGYFEFNIFPAHNFLWKVNNAGINVELTQGLFVLNKIGAPKKSGGKLFMERFYRTSLSELQVKFVKSQSEFVLQVVRIAKFWYHTLEFGRCDDEFWERSTLIETVAIFAGREIEGSALGNPANKLFRAFKKFLTLLVKFNDLNIVMMDTLREINITVPDFIMEQAQEGPLVLDPGNPYNNLASSKTISEPEVSLLEEFAAESKARLLKYRTEDDFELVQVFIPQPRGEWIDGKLRDLADISLALT